MYAAPAFVEAYWHQVPASMNITQPNGDLWIFPCGTKLPDIHVSIGGGKQKPVNIPGSKLNAGEFATVKNGMSFPILFSREWNKQGLEEWVEVRLGG